jgi:hypothetical protein
LNNPPHITVVPPSLGFCALEYSPGFKPSTPSDIESVILFAIKSESGAVSLLLHPQWQRIVQDPDLPYFAGLIEDFRARAKLQPDALFQHLCSLSVGPLIVHQSGTVLAEDPKLSELSAQFVRA